MADNERCFACSSDDRQSPVSVTTSTLWEKQNKEMCDKTVKVSKYFRSISERYDRTTCCRDIEAVTCDSYIICRQKYKRRLLFYWVTYFWSRCVWVDNWINRIIKNSWRCTLCSHYWLCYIEWTKSQIHRRRRLRNRSAYKANRTRW